MFKIIGADQKEYGPVSTAQIRQWITDGRLSAVTQAQRATGGDWQPLSAFEEFADIFNPAGAAPTPEGIPAAMSATPTGIPLPTAAREMALSAVKGPAIALLTTGALGVAFYLFRTLFFLSGHLPLRALPSNAAPFTRAFVHAIQGPACLFFVAINGFILFGALRMLKLQGHTLAIITCIVAMIPCIPGLCCALTLPFGIWGIIVLNKPDVKSQFTN
jgi:hypothetical protein